MTTPAAAPTSSPAATRAPAADADAEAHQLARARDGDREAFEALYRRHAPRIHALCLRMTGRSEAMAQDCLQETFVKAWLRLPEFEARSRFSTWLHRIAVNEVLDQRRRAGNRPTEEIDEEAFAAPAEAGADVGDLALERAVAALPPRARDVLVLVGIHGHSHEEAGALLGIAAGTCKAQLHRARRLLAERLGL
ncbi:MAG: sigma-70 family RNA polymerase sigma factor, partial [Pseudomonadales bacterium]|nr:sigma-70 family RNA polymerase sigma factor [Pseudomonadales bacterium]